MSLATGVNGCLVVALLPVEAMVVGRMGEQARDERKEEKEEKEEE